MSRPPAISACVLQGMLALASVPAHAGCVLDALASFRAAERMQPDDTELTRLQRLHARYDRTLRPHLAPRDLVSLSPDDARGLFEATYIMVLHEADRRHADDLDRVWSRLTSMAAAGPKEMGEYYRALLQMRRFARAAAFSERYPVPAEEPVPYVRAQPGVAALAYRGHPSRNVLEEVAPSLSGTRLLIIAHPLCAFSRRALAALAALPDLPDGLAQRTLLLAPVGPRLHLPALREWNAASPGQQIVLARSRADWPMVVDWATPQFYLLQDGRVVDHFGGWPPEGRGDRLRRLLTRFQECAAGRCP